MDASEKTNILAKGGCIMARITVTLPEKIHQQVLKIAAKENDSISYTLTRLVEIGLLVMNNNDKNTNDKKTNNIEEYCQKLIIQINGIIKEIAVDKLNFDNNKIVQITNDTLKKFNKLKGIEL